MQERVDAAVFATSTKECLVEEWNNWNTSISTSLMKLLDSGDNDCRLVSVHAKDFLSTRFEAYAVTY